MLKTRVSQVARAVNTSSAEMHIQSLTGSTALMDKGTILHSLILESKMPDECVLLDFDSYRTKDAQTAKAEALSMGKIPLLAKEVEEYSKLDISEIQDLFKGCDVEIQSPLSEYMDLFQFTGKCDAVNRKAKHIYDLKCTNAMTFSKISKSIWFSGYDVQLYLYMLLFDCETGSIVFFNADSGLFQVVDMVLEDMQDSCHRRIVEKALPNLLELEKIKSGAKRLPNTHYFPYE